MKIHYLDCDGKAKLFSFHRHDYKTLDLDGKHYMIDGGFDYTRCSTDGKVEEDEVKNLISNIREVFTWTQNYDENNNRIDSKTALLKDLTSSHICGILSYFNTRLWNGTEYRKAEGVVELFKHFCTFQDIFIQELDYRIKNQLI